MTKKEDRELEHQQDMKAIDAAVQKGNRAQKEGSDARKELNRAVDVAMGRANEHAVADKDDDPDEDEDS